GRPRNTRERALDEEVLPDGERLGLWPAAVESERDERPPGADVVADDQELELPGARLEEVGLVWWPGTTDLDDDRARPLRDAVVIDGGQVDDPVGVGEDVDEVGLAGQLVRRLQQPSVELGPGADPFGARRLPAVHLEHADAHVACGRAAAVVEAQA